MNKAARIKHQRRIEKLRAALPPVVPMHEQSTDLTGPGADAFESAEKRAELKRSERAARRKKIREDNFLKSM
jgi:large subunit ribosomal protein L54